jgi:hypothetical protein
MNSGQDAVHDCHGMPDLELAKNYGYNRQPLKEIESLVEDHSDELVSAWKQHFSS